MTASSQSELPPTQAKLAGANSANLLNVLLHGTIESMPEIDEKRAKEFRASVEGMGRQLQERMPEADKAVAIQTILFELEEYRKSVEGEIRDRQNGWRALGTTLVQELLASMGIGGSAAGSIPLVEKMASLSTGEEIQAYRGQLAEFLHPFDDNDDDLDITSPLDAENHSTGSDNAAGLQGGGRAIEDLQAIMNRGGRGFVVSFRIGCLTIINERFGWEAVQDCLMAVSSYITHNLHSDDTVYHWSNSTLLGILQGRPSRQILTAELQRIATSNRETTIKIGGRTIMLRIPLEFEITPISKLRVAADLYKIARERPRSV
jgi:GGDEF domain-containing protein